VTSQTISVAPSSTSTSPGSSAPATYWAARASMVPAPTAGPTSPMRPTGSHTSATTSGNRSGVVAQPVPSNSGLRQNAVA
jgi:hypothetical protein